MSHSHLGLNTYRLLLIPVFGKPASSLFLNLEIGSPSHMISKVETWYHPEFSKLRSKPWLDPCPLLFPLPLTNLHLQPHISCLDLQESSDWLPCPQLASCSNRRMDLKHRWCYSLACYFKSSLSAPSSSHSPGSSFQAFHDLSPAHLMTPVSYLCITVSAVAVSISSELYLFYLFYLNKLFTGHMAPSPTLPASAFPCHASPLLRFMCQVFIDACFVSDSAYALNLILVLVILIEVNLNGHSHVDQLLAAFCVWSGKRVNLTPSYSKILHYFIFCFVFTQVQALAWSLLPAVVPIWGQPYVMWTYPIEIYRLLFDYGRDPVCCYFSNQHFRW